MKLSVLTTITDPQERQDKWQEAFACYLDLADEVVIVNGGIPFTKELVNNLNSKIKVVDLPWPYEWNWAEYSRHLNEGLEKCTGDWILRLDIDQFIHEKDFAELRMKLENLPPEYEVATLQKMSLTYKSKYYQKGEQQICMRKYPGMCFGRNLDKETDLCFPIRSTGMELVEDETINYELPRGYGAKSARTGTQYWNYDYFFKTKEFTKKEFWRAARAWNRYYKDWAFGDSEENSFKYFLGMLEGRYERAPYTANVLDIHPKYIQQAIFDLKPEQFGYSGWGLV